MFAAKPFGNVRPDTYALKGSRTVIVTADEHDVFGDGRVIIKRAPGIPLAIRCCTCASIATGGVVLSGDLYHYDEERTLGRLPTFEFNEEQTRAARASVDAFLKKTGAQLWIQHHLPAHTALRKAPAYLRLEHLGDIQEALCLGDDAPGHRVSRCRVGRPGS